MREAIETSTPCVVICPGYHGHAIARSLGRLGITVYGVHANRWSPAANSRYWRRNYLWDLDKPSANQSLEWLLKLASMTGTRPILIPTDDRSCLFVDQNAEVLREKYIFPRQQPGLASSLINKQKFYALCRENSIPTAATRFPQSRDDVREYVRTGNFPLILKGIDTDALKRRLGVKMAIAYEGQALLSQYDQMQGEGAPDLMVQEYIQGGPGNEWMFDGYFDDQSECLFGVTARKLRQYPAYGGITSLGVCESNETLMGVVTRFLKTIAYRGIVDVDAKYDQARGKLYLLDVNPRVGCSFRLFVDSIGMDVVRALYCDLTRQSISAGKTIEGRRWVAEPFEIISSVRYWRDGNLTVRDWLGSYRGVAEAQFAAWDDMGPLWGLVRYSVASMVRRKSGRDKRSVGY